MTSDADPIPLDRPKPGERLPLGVPCKYCGSENTFIVMRLEPAPIGTFALAGVGMKTTAKEWPWAVCDGCGHESRGTTE